MTDALHLLDQQVDRFGGSVGHVSDGEAGEQLGAPGVQGAGQPVQFGDVVGGTQQAVELAQVYCVQVIAVVIGVEAPQVVSCSSLSSVMPAGC